MGFLDRKERVVDFVLTERGRKLYAIGQLDFTYFSLLDDGLDYDPTYNQFTVGNPWNMIKVSGSFALDAGSTSKLLIPGDGGVEFVAHDLGSTKYVGLAYDPQVDLTSIASKYLIRYDVTDYDAYANGVVIQNALGLVYGDVLRVERVGGTVYWKKNGAVYAATPEFSSGPLCLVTMNASIPGPIDGIRLFDQNGDVQIVWNNLINVAVSGTVTPTVVTDADRERQVSALPSWEAPFVRDVRGSTAPLEPVSHLFAASDGYGTVPFMSSPATGSQLDLMCDQGRDGGQYRRTGTSVAQIDLGLSGEAEATNPGFLVRVFVSGSQGLQRLLPRRDLAGRRSYDPFLSAVVDDERTPDSPKVSVPASRRAPNRAHGPDIRLTGRTTRRSG